MAAPGKQLEVSIEIVAMADNFLSLNCSKCHEPVILTMLGRQERYSGGGGKHSFQIECPKCGPLGMLVAKA